MIYCEKVKLRPNKELTKRLDTLFNVSRFTYNFLLSLAIRNGYSKERKPTLSKIYELQKEFRALVNTGSIYNRHGEIYPFEFQEILRGAPSLISDNECKYLHRAFSTLKKRDVPSFKKVGECRDSFTLQRCYASTFKLQNGILTVRSMSFNLRKTRFLRDSEQIKVVTVAKDTYGYFLSIVLEIEEGTFTKQPSEVYRKVGIDWGVKKFATDSNGDYYSFKEQKEMYSIYCRLENRLKALQKILSKKRLKSPNWRSSNRYSKLREKVRHLYGRLANIRKNFIHHVSKYYAMNFDEVNIESLKPSNMLKNHKLARRIAEAMYYTWKVTLAYKCKLYGTIFNLVDPRNTTQTCSACGVKSDVKIHLGVEIFKCQCCNTEIDRDWNAAINICNR